MLEKKKEIEELVPPEAPVPPAKVAQPPQQQQQRAVRRDDFDDEDEHGQSRKEDGESSAEAPNNGGGDTMPASAALSKPEDPFSFGGSVDLSFHRQDDTCWMHFDFGFVTAWQEKAALFCAPPAGASAVDYAAGLAPGSERALAPPDGTAASWLRCRVTVDEHLPGPTAPHTLCDGANIVLDTGKLTPTDCLASRPGYKCGMGGMEQIHWAWAEGALAGVCERNEGLFHSGSFPNDHLKDTMASWSSGAVTASELTSLPVSDGPIVLLVARERAEHANAFHATTDFLNAFIALHSVGAVDGLSGSRGGMERVQVVLLDEQKGPFDDVFWRRVFSPSHPVLRVSALQTSSRPRLRLPRAVFVPPGYTNMLLSHVDSEGDCHAGTQLFQSYRRFVLAALGLPPNDHHSAGDADDATSGGGSGSAGEGTLRVTFISRRPYSSFVDHSFVGRQIDNEEALMAAMAGPGSGCEGAGACDVRRVDFATIDAAEQVALLAGTDVLVAMHGAALTQAIYMPPHGGVLELWPKPREIWRCFEHVAAMSGLTYVRWENKDFPGAFRTDVSGDYTTVNIAEFGALYRDLVSATRTRKTARHRPEREHVQAAAKALQEQAPGPG